MIVSEHCVDMLRLMADGPVVDLRINPGLRRLLVMRGLGRWVQLPSPYAKDKGGQRDHMEITADGRTVLDFAHELRQRKRPGRM